jgi:DNA-binding beta-propeller fold protein YncE
MKRRIPLFISLIIPLALVSFGSAMGLPVLAVEEDDGGAYEVWVIDQSDTTADGGGTLYIYQGSDLAGQSATTAVPEVIDLGGAARTLCIAQTGTAPRRPHMTMFNTSHTHAIVAFVATGHVLFMDGMTRQPVACIDVGAQAHAAMPTADENYVVVANQNGKLLQRINTHYETNTFTLDNSYTLNLATCTTPSGAPCEDQVLRPDNAPICPVIEESGRFTFVTLRGGGMFVVDSTATPMQIVGEYDRGAIHPNGCGGVELWGKMYINAGGGTPANPLESDLYNFPIGAFSTLPNPPNTPAPYLVFSHDNRGFVDSHGAVLTKHDRYLWVADRAANRIIVVDTRSDEVVNEIVLAGEVSNDPAPDLMDISHSGNRIFMALRGPNPLTGNAPGVNNAVGSTPGVGVIRVEKSGRQGVFFAIAPITHIVGGVERADPHALMVRHK